MIDDRWLTNREVSVQRKLVSYRLDKVDFGWGMFRECKSSVVWGRHIKAMGTMIGASFWLDS